MLNRVHQAQSSFISSTSIEKLYKGFIIIKVFNLEKEVIET